jgi:hypothetical protein
METSIATHGHRLPKPSSLPWLVSVKWVLMVILLALSGCATTIGRNFDESKLATFKPNQTTIEDVIAQLGPPTERETESDGQVRLHYQWIKSSSGVSDYVPVVSMFHTSVNTEAKDVFLWFGPDHKYIRSEQNEMHSS